MSQSKYNKLAGKHVVIFGATSGIGFAVADASLAASASVTISSSSQSRIDATIQKLSAAHPGSKIGGHPCDLSGEDIEAQITALFEKIGTADHIVYTAADKIVITPVQEITREKIIAAGQLRFIGPMLVAKIGSRYLSPGPNSSITMTSGIVNERPIPNWTIAAGYAGGIPSMARNLAIDLKPIRVNVVRAGLVNTAFWDGPLTPEQKEGMFGAFTAKLPLGKIAEPEDIVESYLYLMKDHNATGQIVTTDSGALIV